jgi:hypothetical protein
MISEITKSANEYFQQKPPTISHAQLISEPMNSFGFLDIPEESSQESSDFEQNKKEIKMETRF